MVNDYSKRRNTLKDYSLNLLFEESDDEGAKGPFPQQTVAYDSDSEADDYKTDASSYGEDSEEEMADGDEVNSMKDDLDIGVSEKSKPGNGTSRVNKTAGTDDYSKHRDKWPMVRDAGYHIAHPPSMFFKEVTSSPRPNSTHKGKGKNKNQPNVSLASGGSDSSGKPLKDLQRAWMNKSYGALFRNNNNRLREGGPMNCYTAFGGKAGRFLENEGLHPNLSSGMVDWLHDTTGEVVCPQTIEERQIVRCDENFGEHLHGNPDGRYSIACSHKHVPSDFKHEYRLEGDFLFCHECASHQHQELTSDQENGIRNGALAPMCEGCAVKYATSEEIGFGTLDCDCDLEPNCLEHRKPVLEGLHNSLMAFSKAHRTKKRRGAHDQPSDGRPATKCPACCRNTPPPVGTHFAYMCVACSGAVILPPPGDAHAWQTGRPGQLQGFIVALGRPSSHANLKGVRNKEWLAIMEAYIQGWEATNGPCQICLDEAAAVDDAGGSGAASAAPLATASSAAGTKRKRVAAADDDDDATQRLTAPKHRELEAEGKARAGGEAPVRP